MKAECGARHCNRPRAARGYCRAHVTRLRVYGDVREHIPLRPRRTGKPPKQCIANGCGRTKVVGYGYCGAHLYRYHRYGDPLAHIAIGDGLAMRAYIKGLSQMTQFNNEGGQ